MNEKPHIGISATILNRNDGKRPLDGIGVYTNSLLSAYRQMGLNPEPYAFEPLSSGEPCQSLHGEFRNMAMRALLPFNQTVRLPVDIFHVTDYMALPMACPVVTTLYDAIPFVDSGMANSRLRRLKNLILRRSAQYADHVIAISNFSTAELIEHYRVPESKISVVYCGVDEDWLNEPTVEDVNQTLRDYGLEPGYFLTVGTLQPRKNVASLLRAHSALPLAQRKSHPLVVVGKRGWNCEGLVRQLEDKIFKREAIWLSNVHSRNALKCLYAGAEAFLFPSLYEGFGLPVLEAFAMGLPVLTSNTTSLPEVSNGIAFEIDPLNLSEMTECMSYLLSLPDKEVRVAAGRQRARDLSWSRCAAETLKVYQTVLNG